MYSPTSVTFIVVFFQTKHFSLLVLFSIDFQLTFEENADTD